MLTCLLVVILATRKITRNLLCIFSWDKTQKSYYTYTLFQIFSVVLVLLFMKRSFFFLPFFFFLNLGKEKRLGADTSSKIEIPCNNNLSSFQTWTFLFQNTGWWKKVVFFFSILVKGRKILSMRIYNESFHTSIVKKEEKKIQFFLPILTQRRKNVSMSIYRGAYPKCSGSFSHLQGESEHLEFVLLYNLNSAIFWNFI